MRLAFSTLGTVGGLKEMPPIYDDSRRRVEIWSMIELGNGATERQMSPSKADKVPGDLQGVARVGHRGLLFRT